jgi:hypothetical protein
MINKKMASIQMNHKIMDKIEENPTLLNQVEQKLLSFEKNHRLHPNYILKLKNLLSYSTNFNENIDFMRKQMTQDNDEGELLRSITPFTGILTFEERQFILDNSQI